MGFLDAINPLNVVSDVASDFIEETVGGIFGEAVGDIASGIFNYSTGNIPGLIDDALDLLENVKGGVKSFCQEFLEIKPDPPPCSNGDFAMSRSPTGDILFGDVNLTQLTKDLQRATESVSNTSSCNTSGSSAAVSEHAHSSSNSMSAATPASSGGTTDIHKLFRENPKQLYDDVLNGRIPDEILNDPSAQMALQAQIQTISRAFTAMTNMMSAMHDMQMSIIRNLRA